MPLAPLSTPINLKRVRVRLINACERAQWDALMRAHHYLGFVALVGRSLRYVAEIDGQWLGDTEGITGGEDRLNCAVRGHDPENFSQYSAQESTDEHENEQDPG